MSYSKGSVLDTVACCGGGGASLPSDQELLCTFCTFDWDRREDLWAAHGCFTKALIKCMRDRLCSKFLRNRRPSQMARRHSTAWSFKARDDCRMSPSLKVTRLICCFSRCRSRRGMNFLRTRLGSSATLWGRGNRSDLEWANEILR